MEVNDRALIEATHHITGNIAIEGKAVEGRRDVVVHGGRGGKRARSGEAKVDNARLFM